MHETFPSIGCAAVPDRLSKEKQFEGVLSSISDFGSPDIARGATGDGLFDERHDEAILSLSGDVAGSPRYVKVARAFLSLQKRRPVPRVCVPNRLLESCVENLDPSSDRSVAAKLPRRPQPRTGHQVAHVGPCRERERESNVPRQK